MRAREATNNSGDCDAKLLIQKELFPDAELFLPHQRAGGEILPSSTQVPSMPSTNKHPEAVIAAFMADETARNRWLVCQHVSVYVRKSMHIQHRGAKIFYKPCIDVANWNTRGPSSRRTGRLYTHAQVHQLVDFMKAVERAVVKEGYGGIVAECVGNAVLRKHLRKNHYARLPGGSTRTPCFFKPTATVLARSPWVQDLRKSVHGLARPSMRAFAEDATLERFWVRDQASKFLLLLQRERCRDPSLVPRQRITVLQIVRESRDGTDAAPTDSDKAALARVLDGLQRRLHDAYEIVLCGAALASVPTSERGWWLNRLGFDSERSSRPGAAGRFVKRLR